MATKAKGHEDVLYLAVVAIDFGTTYSGFAFSFNSGGEKEEIFLNREWTNEQNCKTHKTPTCLLLNPDHSLHSFGYDAVEKYSELQSEKEEKEYLFFQHFKMELLNNKDVNLATTINAANGKPFKVLEVFVHSITFMKEEALKVLANETGDKDFKVLDIQWVVTVPAIWTPRAKQFMRAAAYEAGIGSKDNPKQLIIALEPEAAAIFCWEKKLSKLENHTGVEAKDSDLPKPGSDYMVVDIGGGTLDVAVHKIASSGTIKEIDKITGGSYGGLKVNQRFKELLSELMGEENVVTYERENPSDWLALMNDFEGKKQGFRVNKGKDINIRLPASFKYLTNRIYDSVLESYGPEKIKFRNSEYMTLAPDVMKGLFRPVLSEIKNHLKRVLQRPQLSRVKTMFLVGGFSDSELLRQEIGNEFSDRCLILAPRNAAIAVLEGAVMFGKNPAKIAERVVSMTYGAGCYQKFDKTIHPQEKRFVVDGRHMCKDVFSLFVKEDEVTRLGEGVKRMYVPLRAHDTLISLGFYVATNPNTKFTTDEGVTMIGSVNVESPDISLGRDRDIEVYMHFGGTEIVATAVDVTSGNKAETSLNFFHK